MLDLIQSVAIGLLVVWVLALTVNVERSRRVEHRILDAVEDILQTARDAVAVSAEAGKLLGLQEAINSLQERIEKEKRSNGN